MRIFQQIKSQQIFRDSFWALFGSVVGKGLSLIGGIIVANILTKEVYGEYGIIKNTLFYIAVFSTFGLGFTATKYIAEYRNTAKEKIRTIVRCATIITSVVSVTMAVLVVIFAQPIATYLEAPHLFSALRISSIAIIFNAFDTAQIGILSGFGAFRTNAQNTAIAGVVNFVMSLLLTLKFGLTGSVWAMVLSFATSALLNYISIHKILQDYPKSSYESTKTLKDIIKFSTPIALQESLYSVTHWGTIAIFAKLAGYGELALHSAAGQWQAIILFIPGVLRNVTLSHLSNNTRDADKHHGTLKTMLKINFLSSFIPFLFVACLSKVISQCYGPTFSDLPYVLIASVSIAIANSLSNVYSQELISRGRNWFLFWSRLFKDIIILVAAFILLSTLKTNGAVIMCLITLFAQTLYLIVLHLSYKYDRLNK